MTTKLRISKIFDNLFKRRKDLSKEFHEEDVNFIQETLFDQYISYLQNHPDSIVSLSLDGRINPKNSSNKIFGHSLNRKEEFRQIMSEEDYRRFSSAFERSTTGSIERMALKIFSEQGKEVFLIATFVPIQSDLNKIKSVIISMLDISFYKNLEESFLSKATHLEQAQQIANIGSWEHDFQQNKVSCSQTFLEIFGYKDANSMTKDSILSLVVPEDYEKVKRLFHREFTKPMDATIYFRINHALTREVRYLKMEIQLILKKGQPFKLIGTVKDQTVEKQMGRQLMETSEGFKYIFDHLHVGIWMKKSLDGEVFFLSKGIEHIFQFPLEELYREKNHWDNFILAEHQDEVSLAYKQLKEGQHISIKYRILTGDGTIKWVHERAVPRVNKQGRIEYLFGMITDISAIIEMKKRLEYLATHDELTGLPKGRNLDQKIIEFIKDDTVPSFAVSYIDIDNFHWVRNYLGRKLSNQVLQRVANRIKRNLPESSFLARESKDTFVILIPKDSSKDRIFEWAEKIVKAIEQKMSIEGYEIYVTASMGISFYPDNGTEKMLLLERAQSALYHAKQLGKNNYQIYSFDWDIETHKKYMLEKDLRQAIKEEAFKIYYQPQVNPANGAMVSAEALIRWPHEEWGLISPKEFIPIAEEAHLIHDISQWMVKNVCKQINLWKEAGHLIVPISINISPVCLLRENFVKDIHKILEDYQISPKNIVLEITESALIKDETKVLDYLQELKELGINIAIDDFGKKYSILSYLQDYDFDVLKIDRSFIRPLNLQTENETKEAVIVNSLIYLSKGLGMRVIAEGVEEYAQLEFLKQKQCEAIQGYIYSKPVPVEQFEKLLKHPYLKPQKQKEMIDSKKNRRKFFRFAFTFPVAAKLQITEVNQRKVDIGSAKILIEDIGLGGIRFLTPLKLPVVSSFKLNFTFKLMGKMFTIEGALVYRDKEREDLYAYGATFKNITEGERDALAERINRMTVKKRFNQGIPNTEFITTNPRVYFQHK